MFDHAVVPLGVTCLVVRAVEYFVFVCTACSHLIRACVMVGENAHVFCSVAKGLHVWKGI